jgi:hypothetical protein
VKSIALSLLAAVSACAVSGPAFADPQPMSIVVKPIKYISNVKDQDAEAYGKAIGKLLEEKLVSGGKYVLAPDKGPMPTAMLVGDAVLVINDSRVKKPKLDKKAKKDDKLAPKLGGEYPDGSQIEKNTVQVELHARLLETATGQILGAADGIGVAKLAPKKDSGKTDGKEPGKTDEPAVPSQLPPDQSEGFPAMQQASEKVGGLLTLSADKVRSLLSQ